MKRRAFFKLVLGAAVAMTVGVTVGVAVESRCESEAFSYTECAYFLYRRGTDSAWRWCGPGGVVSPIFGSLEEAQAWVASPGLSMRMQSHTARVGVALVESDTTPPTWQWGRDC